MSPLHLQSRRSLLTWMSVWLMALVSPSLAAGQSVDNVLLVVNDRSDTSREIAAYYQRKRGVASDHVVHVTVAPDEEIDRPEYLATIEQPLARHLAVNRLQDRVLYILLTKGVPLRVRGTTGPTGTIASLDSELTLLYRRMVGSAVPVQGRVDNPYFLGTRAVEEARPFTHRDHDIYLVSRLDGFTLTDALGLVDRGLAAGSEGRVVLDRQGGQGAPAGEAWLEEAGRRLTAAKGSERVVLERTSAPARQVSNVLGYYSWGSNDPHNRARRAGMSFVPGALAAMFVSTDARTFAEPPPEWSPSASWNTPSALFADSPQSLTADLVRDGITGVAGHVAEPYLQSTIRPEVLFPAYFSGFNLVESFYLAMPHLGWQTVVIGDPLTNPFPRRSAVPGDIEDVVDARTSLPGFFARRRLALASAELPLETAPVVAAVVRAHALIERGDLAGGAGALEQALSVAPHLANANLQLAMLNERMGRPDEAMERYRRVLERDATNAVALNNLAFLLATHLARPVDALPLALRASDAAHRHPLVLDTLGWIQYLLGDTVAAQRTLTDAVQGAPNAALVRLHLATVSAAVGSRTVAETELAEALRLDAGLDTSDLVTALRRQLRITTVPR